MVPGWGLFAFSGYVALVNAHSSIRVFQKSRKLATARQEHKLPPRPKTGQVEWMFIMQLAIVVFLASELLNDQLRLTDIGFSNVVSLPSGLFLGAAAYPAVVGIYALLIRGLGLSRQDADHHAVLALRAFWPRSRSDKRLAFVAMCILNPWTEEILYRGVLLFALSANVGGVVFPITLGLGLTLAAHLYQGPFNLFWHGLFFGGAVVILFSPLGLAGAIGFHALADLVPVVSLRRDMLQWRTRQRASKVAG